MIKKKLFHLTACMALFTVSTLHAQEIEVYYAALGVGAYSVEYTESRATGGLSVQASSMPAGLIKIGVDAELWGAELRLGAVSSATSSPFAIGTLGSATPFTLKIQASPFLSYLGKLQYPISDAMKVYVLLGGTMANFSINPSGTTVLLNSSATKTGFTYGLGAEFKPYSDFSVGVEWIQYWTNVDMSVSAAGRSRASFGGLNISINQFFDF